MTKTHSPLVFAVKSVLERNQKQLHKLEVLEYLKLVEAAQSIIRNCVTPTETRGYG